MFLFLFDFQNLYPVGMGNVDGDRLIDLMVDDCLSQRRLIGDQPVKRVGLNGADDGVGLGGVEAAATHVFVSLGQGGARLSGNETG